MFKHSSNRLADQLGARTLLKRISIVIQKRNQKIRFNWTEGENTLPKF